MNVNDLTPAQYQIRQNVRNFLLIATYEELKKECQISLEAGDHFRADCVRELIYEYERENRDKIPHGNVWD